MTAATDTLEAGTGRDQVVHQIPTSDQAHFIINPQELPEFSPGQQRKLPVEASAAASLVQYQRQLR